MKDLLIINFFYGDIRVPTSRMTKDVFEFLKKKKVKPNIFTSNSFYKNLKKKSNQKNNLKDIIETKNLTNIEIINRLFFFIKVFFYIRKNRYKKFLILTDPPFIIFLAPVIKIYNPKSEIIYWTMDLYPEALRASRISLFKLKFFFIFIKSIKNFCLKSVDKIITLGSCQKKILKTYTSLNKKKKIIITPWDNRDLKTTQIGKKKFIKKYPFFNKKVILYAGNVGRAHSIDQIISLINYSNKIKSQMLFLFACHGHKKKYLIQKTNHLKNVLIKDYFSEDETSYLFEFCNFQILSLHNNWNGIVVPSKIFSIALSKKPVIYFGPRKSEVYKIIKKYNLGLFFDDRIDAKTVYKKINSFKTFKFKKRKFEKDNEKKIKLLYDFLNF